MLDCLIENALICQGNKESARVGRVGLQGDRIAYLSFGEVENVPQAISTIDGTDLILSPGFIDPHASTGFGYFFPRAADHKLYQGITTEIFGNCGTSPGPIGEHLVPTMDRLSGEIGFPFEWRTLGEYFEKIQDHLQFNIGSLVGHSTLRAGHMEDWHDLKPEHLSAMKGALEEAMLDGALGLSTGLIYAPSCFAEMEEIVDLAALAGKMGGVYASHIRNERDKLEEAVTEALEIGKRSGARVLVSHLKAAEKPNWGKIPKVLKQIEEFNKGNTLQAAIDVYPYTAVSTKLRAFIPKYILQDGIKAVADKMIDPVVVKDIEDWILQKEYDFQQMLVISNEFEQYGNKTVSQIAVDLNISEGQAIAQILKDSTETWVVYHCIQQEDIDAAVTWPHSMICTDSWSYPVNAPNPIGRPHPRSYGAFTTFLERYVLKEKLLNWEEAIHKITYLPAEFFGLVGRGLIKEGFFADLVLLNPRTLKANASYESPMELSSGVEYLWVNGKMVISEGNIEDVYPGKVLKPEAAWEPSL